MVVTAILVVVRDSLALAFSLAGIVAAVRFRNNLRESGDAVYIFGAIGIGFASGIHALSVAAVLSIVFVAVFARLPATAVADRPSSGHPGIAGRRNAIAGVLAGLSAFAVIWSALSRPPLGPPDAAAHIRLTPDAHGGDVVTVILADFRGLDTMVEITVLAVAVIGVTSLLRRRSEP